MPSLVCVHFVTDYVKFSLLGGKSPCYVIYDFFLCILNLISLNYTW